MEAEMGLSIDVNLLTSFDPVCRHFANILIMYVIKINYNITILQ